MQHRTAVIGCGLWGKNIVRNFYNLGVLDTVCDMDEDNLKMVAQNYPEVKRTKDFNDILNNPNIDSVAWKNNGKVVKKESRA